MIEAHQIDALALPPRSLYVLKERLAGKTLHQVGSRMGITRERVRQIEKVALHSISDSELAEQIKHDLGPYTGKRRADLLYTDTRRTLAQSLEGGFHRAEILKLADLEADPWLASCPEEDLCDWLHDTFHLTRFGGKYIYCLVCHHSKAIGEFGPGVAHNKYQSRICRQCGAERGRKSYLRNKPHLLAYARKRKNRMAIYALRARYKKLGLLDKMPPLPPKGKPGDISPEYVKQFSPHHGSGSGTGLRNWLQNATPEQLRERYLKGRATHERKRLQSAGV